MSRPSSPGVAERVDTHQVRNQLRNRLHARGLRWTPQRRLLIDVLDQIEGHVTGSDLVEACREVDPGTTPSTVYRTLDVLEELGVVSHSHGHDGREEYHIRPVGTHGHLVCDRCGSSWDLVEAEADALVRSVREHRAFEVDLGHLTVVGRCAACAAATAEDGG